MRAAEAVVVLGGNPDPDFDAAIELRERILALDPEGRLGRDYDHMTDVELAKYGPIAGEDRRWAVLGELFENPWFRRVWVIQEAIAALHVWMLYGKLCLKLEWVFFVWQRAATHGLTQWLSLGGSGKVITNLVFRTK